MYFYTAIHIITESSDHYNLLLCIENIKDKQIIKEQLINSVSESPEHWSIFYVTCEDNSNTATVKEIINELIDSYFSG